MTFLKRHWPDMLIVAMIAVLLSGFLLVLTGGPQVTLRLPFGPFTTTTAPPAATDPNTVAAQPELPAVPASTTDPVLPATAEPQEQPIPTIPSAPATREDDGQGEPTGAAALTPAPDDTLPPGRDVVPTSRQSTPTRAEFRISAGVFAEESVARARTDVINELGYVVHLIPIEQGVVAQVGPFGTQVDAERAQQQIRGVYPSLTLQPPLGQTLAPRTIDVTSDPAPTTASAAADALLPAAAATTTPAPTTGTTGTYLQVGAFSTSEYAAPLIERLRAQGYTPTVNAPPGEKIRVLIGPYANDALQRTQQQLDALGIQHFRVR